MEKNLQFDGPRVQLPWRAWQREDVQICPEGIYTPRAFIPIERLNLLLWQAAFYNRGEKINFT